MAQLLTTSCLLLVLLAATRGVAPAESGDASADSGINRPVSSREVEQLNLQISDASRSSVEAIGEYHTETGDLNDRLDFWRFGGKLNYRTGGGSSFYVRAVQTQYMTTNHFLDENGFNVTGGFKASLSDAVTAQFELGATRFSTSASTVNGMGSLRYHTSGGSAIYVTGSRTNVEETLLSAAGVRTAAGPFAGQVVGLVMDNRGVAGGSYQMTPKFDLFAEGGVGERTGRNIESNFMKIANAGAGYNLLSLPDDNALSLVRASYSLEYFGFEKNLWGFGGASLQTAHGSPMDLALIGSDGISPAANGYEPGVGGYFSPQAFVSNVGRIEIQGHPHPRLEYRLAGFLGGQDYTGSAVRQAHGLSASATVHLNDRFSVPVTYVRDNFGPFTQQSVFFRLIARI